MRTLTLALLFAVLTACAAPNYIDRPSANQDGRIRFLVLHFTDENFERSLDLLTRPHDNPVSAHYLVSRAGEAGRATPSVLRLVDESQRAWHAGPSRWQGHEPLNGESIGVEIVYESHCPREPPRSAASSPWDVDATCPYPAWPADQIAAVIELARGILERHPEIEPTRIVGHSDIQPENKTDPGPRFPWKQLAEAGVGAWPDEVDVGWYRERFEQSLPEAEVLFDALTAYGYGLQANGRGDLRRRDVLCAFQSHFLPQQRSGVFDAPTAATLLALLSRYRSEELARLRERWPQLPPPRPAAAR